MSNLLNMFFLYIFQVCVGSEKVLSSKCTCTIGQSGSCGHITSLLYQLAYYKQMKMKFIPSDIAKTSLPQTWHHPRGEKLRGTKVDDIVVQGYDKENPHRPTKGIRTTLCNPIPDNADFDVEDLASKTIGLNILFPTVLCFEAEKVQTKFGKYPKGSVFGYQ